MEFVEITSTYENPVNFNDTYEFVYNDTVQKVTTMDDNADVVIQPEEKVVLWIIEVMSQLRFLQKQNSGKR